MAPSVWLGNVSPIRTRKLFFSERPEDPDVQGSPTVFMITEDGRTPAPYNPHAAEPDIMVHDGDVEDWTIENRSTEAHTFHIHQVHFMLTQWNGAPVDEPFLRDTINVPYSQTITTSNGMGTVNLTVSNVQNAIPGLIVPSSGTSTLTIGGTPTATGTETFTVTATDQAGNTASANYSITVNPAITLSPTSLATGTAQSIFKQTIRAAGGTGTVTLTTSDIQNPIPGLIVPTSDTTELNIGGTPTARCTSEQPCCMPSFRNASMRAKERLRQFIGKSGLRPFCRLAFVPGGKRHGFCRLHLPVPRI